MKKFIIILLLAFVSISFSQTKVKKRQDNQKARIAQGLKSGELTKKEAQNLRKGQKRVKVLKQKAKADGKITKAEKKKINRAQNNQSKKIFKQKHNKQKRPKAKKRNN